MTIREAVWNYLFGGGAAVTVNFSEVDQGLQPRDFPGYSELVMSLYKREGSREVDIKYSKDAGGWAGHVSYRLKGKLFSTMNGNLKDMWEHITTPLILMRLTVGRVNTGKNLLPD